MKSLSYLFMAGLMTLGLWSCSDDANLNSENGEGQTSADKVYMSFKLELPTASRSATDNPSGSGNDQTNSDETPDYEVGKDEENNVQNLVVVLATPDGSNPATYTYLANSSKDYTGNSGSTMYTVTFESAALQDKQGEEVAVFVFCNHPAPNVGEEAIYYQNLLDGTCEITADVDDNIAEANSFWMANAKIHSCDLPNDLSAHNSVSNPYPLGDVEVERTAARFDYQVVDNNQYVIDNTTPNVKVELTHMALVNMSNQFYYLRRVSNTELTGTSDNINLCTLELPSSYVVDADYAEKINDRYLPANFMFYWANKLANNGETVENPNVASEEINISTLWPALEKSGSVTEMSDFTSGTDDNWESTSSTYYKIWRYATENTLPTIATQVKSLSTAILFKGELIDESVGSENRLQGAKAYVFNNVLYGAWLQVKDKVDAVTAGSSSELIALKAAYDAALAATNARLDHESDTEPLLSDASDNGFTVYEKDDNGTLGDTSDDIFPVYYYYMNRHNDNEDPDKMVPMEFAVVRNNVYKLSVTSIQKFGHPANPGGDPDPIVPTDPDETDKIYFTVNVKVCPWVVRVNDIIF